MTCLEIAQQYLDAWNNRDADAILTCFAPGGTYQDPATGQISGNVIRYYAKMLWRSFPDLSFDVVSVEEAGPNKVVSEWIMKGTNTGVYQGIPPTGRSISLPGVDIMQLEEGGIKILKGYFDTQTIPKQLGLQVIIQPRQNKKE